MIAEYDFDANGSGFGVVVGRWSKEYLSQHYIDDLRRINLSQVAKPLPIRISSGEYNSNYNVGCLANTPLRYGDINEDGLSEIVLTTGEDLIVFSPQQEQTVFMQRYNSLGWLDEKESSEYLADNPDSQRTQEPQYLSRIGATTIEKYQFIGQGVRAYAKVYIGEFTGNSDTDILVWHKTYVSNMIGELNGFSLIENKVIHYERDLTTQAESDAGVTGEYLPQETSEDDIQDWLSENDLTWSKGYPSVSECEGEEGKLIPEMHDPLLNDPEVLL